MRSTLLLFALAVSGCQTCTTSRYGPAPGCASCGAPVPGPARVTPEPPPVIAAPRPNVADASPPAMLLEPRAKSEKPPLAAVPPPADDATPPAIDLPGFMAARPGVASGLQPFPDGQEWLARRGYKTVLHLRGPLDDTTAARRQWEKKAINYVSIPVSPATLSREAVDEFIRVVNDTPGHPLFVYDKDGAAAGAMWYLYQRYHVKVDDEAARKEAARLGLREDDEEHKTMWIAVQALLKKSAP